MDISYAAKNYWGENICTYNEYMHIAQALRTLIIEDTVRKVFIDFTDHVYQITNL